MTREEKYKLIELLEKLRDERILEVAEENGLTEKEVREKLNSEPEEVYDDMDDDGLLHSVDTILCALD
jgi:hypothetical protein